tara:strand:- start:2047 stop:2502 length:456 start_codon:yes stop_codon:yes gene_type:complete
MKTPLIIFLVLISSAAFAQIQEKPLESYPNALEINSSTELMQAKIDSGKVEIIEDNAIGVLLEKYNSTKKDFGFRVQIHSGLARVETLKAQTNFMKLYPEISTYVIYQQPNFKVRVGDFESRLEVNRFFEEMKAAFPGAFIIQDEITSTSN